MITLKRSNSDDNLDSSEAFMSVKNQIDEQRTEFEFRHNKLNDREDKLKQIFVKAKSTKIRDAFIQKVMRRVDTDDETMLRIWKNQQLRQISKPTTEGFVYPQQLEHLLQTLNLLCFPVLIVLTCFLGFLDDFSKHYSKNSITIIIKIFCFVVIVLRFLIKLTSVTFSGGQFKKYLKQIVIAYLGSNRLLFDFILMILQMINLFFPESMSIAAILFFYLNLMMIYPGNDTIRTEAAYIQSRRTALFWSLFKIIFFNVFFAHFMATVILTMAKIQPERSWMVRAGIQQKEWYIKYVYAYYWGTTIMMTVGFGDILPGAENWREILMTSFLQMFSCVVLGYNISSIGNIVSKLRDADEVINRKIVVFERMMRRDRKKKVSINPLLQKKISNYLQELRIDKQNLEYVEKDQLLSELPENLRKAYFKEANKRIFPSVMFFNRLKPKTLQILAQKFKSSFYDPGQFLSHQKHIIILENGKVGLGYKKSGATKNGLIMQEVQVKESEPTLLLNPTQFLTFYPQSKYQLISKQNSMVWSITREEFVQTLNESAIDIQYFYSILHKHSIDENEWEFIQCSRCSFGVNPLSSNPADQAISKKNKIYHSCFNCSKLTYLPIRSLTAGFYIASIGSVDNNRIQFFRHKSTLSKKNVLYWKKHLQKDAYEVKINETIKRKGKYNKKPSVDDINNRLLFAGRKQGEQDDSLLSINEQRLKRLIREVLFEHQTNYEEGYWLLECDNLKDYQFYFPQDNPNRLNFTTLRSHPRCYNKNNNVSLASHLKSIVRVS